MLAHWGTVEHSNADRDCCINSVLVNVLTKGQAGAMLRLEGTNLQEPKQIVKETNRELILWFSERVSDSRSQITEN